jgi:hypothetical protein
MTAESEGRIAPLMWGLRDPPLAQLLHHATGRDRRRFTPIHLEQTERNESGSSNRRLTAMAALLPSVPEIRYLLARLMLRPPIAADAIMVWSLWRRRHQLSAAKAHYKRHKMQL